MKKLLLYLICSVFTLSSCVNRKIVITEDKLTNDIFYYNGSITPFNGACEIHYANTDQVKIIMHFKEGKLNGNVKTFYESGDLKAKGHYEDGLMSGKWEGWYVSGKKAYEVYYKSDSLHGDYSAYHENGELMEKGIYQMNDKTGEWKYFDVSGQATKQTSMIAYFP